MDRSALDLFISFCFYYFSAQIIIKIDCSNNGGGDYRAGSWRIICFHFVEISLRPFTKYHISFTKFSQKFWTISIKINMFKYLLDEN